MGLDYMHTCPDIDNAIKTYKDSIVDTLESVIGELNPYLDLENSEVKRVISEHKDSLYNYFEDAFEDVRSTNEDIRREADIQIDKANDDLLNIGVEMDELNLVIINLEQSL